MIPDLLRLCTLLLLLASAWSAEASASRAPAATAPFMTEDEFRGGTPVSSDGAHLNGSLWSIGLSVMAVAGFAVLVGWLVKRTGLKRLLPGNGGHMQVVDRLALGRRRAVLLIKCGDRLFLIGEHEHGLSGCGEMPVDGVSEMVFSKQLLAAQASDAINARRASAP